MTRLSKHFRDEEFACPCCGKLGVSSILVTKILEPIREHFGAPVWISRGGGVRCPEYNMRIRACDDHGNFHGTSCPTCGNLGLQRSAINSWHMRGTQADITVQNIKPKVVQAFARNLPDVTRLGCYRSFTHVGHGGEGFKEWRG